MEFGSWSLFGSWFLVLGILTSIVGCSSETKKGYPNQPIKIVVPFSPGGESDLFARIITKAIKDNGLLPQPLVIQNIDGAGATIGSRVVKNAKPDGYKVLLLHNAIFTAKYSGKTTYGPEAFEPVIGTGEFGMVVAVWKDSELRSLKDLMQFAKKNPKKLKWAANLGAPSQFAGLMLENPHPGEYFGYAPFGSGSDRYAAIKGGHVAVSAFSVGEYVRFDGLRALAYLGEKRHPQLPKLPTAIEQGYDVITGNMQFWWVPKGTSPKHIAVLANALEKAMQTDYVKSELRKTYSEPVVAKGKALHARISFYTNRLSSVALPKPYGIPNIPLIVFVVLLAVILVLAIRFAQSSRSLPPASAIVIPEKQINRNAICGLFILTAYVSVMSLGWLEFRWATMAFVLLFGWTTHQKPWRMMPIYAMLAFVLGFGIHVVFTHWLAMELP